jgi:hypothetical protein
MAQLFMVRHFPNASLSLQLLMRRCCGLHWCLNVPWGAIQGLIVVDCYQQRAGRKDKDDNGIIRSAGRGGGRRRADGGVPEGRFWGGGTCKASTFPLARLIRTRASKLGEGGGGSIIT